MATKLSNLSLYDEKNIPDASAMKFGIVVSEWNHQITHVMYQGCIETLLKHGAKKENIETVQVPGSFELPYGAKLMLAAKQPDAVICLGCIIKGETKHDEYIATAIASGITTLSLAAGKPVIFGVLTPNTLEQAEERAGGKHGNKGVEAAVTAIRMASLKNEIARPKSKIGF